MSDALAIPVLAASALTQGFGFLYGRAEALLGRRAARSALEEEPPPEVVPAIISEAPGARDLDERALTAERVGQIESLLEVLGVYDEHRELIRGDDERLRRNLGRLRSALEDVYGQRIVFDGENRPHAGVRVAQETDDVRGRTRGVKARRVGPEASLEVRQKTKTVHAGAEMIGADIDDLG